MSDIKQRAGEILIPFTTQMLDLVVNALAQRAFAEVAHVIQHIAGHAQAQNTLPPAAATELPPIDHPDKQG